jgi:hypothetical protein
MPNWCANSLKLVASTSKSKQLLRKINKMLKATEPEEYTHARLFQLMKPMPDDLMNSEAAHGGTFEEVEARNKNHQENITKYGYATWYGWALNEWGTKWDARIEFAEITKQSTTIYFDTAWSPPMGVYEHLEKIGFKVEATYCECGVGYAGAYANGKDREFEISFYKYNENDENDERENDRMQSFFFALGFDHNPSHLGG